MNRRAFIAAVPFLPSAANAALSRTEMEAYPHYKAYYADGCGIHWLVEDCGRCGKQTPPDLDAIFERLYALKRRAATTPVHILWRDTRGNLAQIT